jgi:asparagine synthase (glutamine-hydrolysing)
MCGLVGIFDTEGRRPVDAASLARMNATLTHRGPDAAGQHIEPGLGLGHRRLSIVDIASGHQPMTNQQTGCVVTYNGEIYNFRALREELTAKGHHFHTQCDTEVILYAWEEWGKECVSHFNGMFAFALWDPSQETLFIARDALGKKPLYYTHQPDGLLLFASELKGITAWPSLKRDINPQAVSAFFAYGYIPDPLSIYRSISKLPPGHRLICKRGQPLCLEAWWDIDLNLEPSAADDLLPHLDQAVSSRMLADVPLGAFLSGGVDSSAIVASMAATSETPVKTIAIGFDSLDHDETDYANTVAQLYGTDHKEQMVSAEDFGLIDQIAATYDEPFGDVSALPTLQLCQSTRQEVTVALSGDGGDEVFAGYRRYLWHMREEAVRRWLPTGVRKALFGLLGRLYPRLDSAPSFLRAKHTFQELALDDVDAYFLSVAITDDEERKTLLGDDVQAALGDYDPADILRAHWAAAKTDDPLKKAQYADLKTWLPGDILVKVDRASMAHSLEVRAPFLDRDFVTWGINLSTEEKLAGGEKKAVLKKALKGRVPDDVLYRPKQGFVPPLADWCRGPMVERLRHAIDDPLLSASGFVNVQTARQLLNDHIANKRDNSRVLWLILMFHGFLKHDAGIGS